MNRADKMLRTLRNYAPDWVSRTTLFAHAHDYYLTNNAASELRARGYVIDHERRGRGDYYRLGRAS